MLVMTSNGQMTTIPETMTPEKAQQLNNKVMQAQQQAQQQHQQQQQQQHQHQQQQAVLIQQQQAVLQV